jgi:manganese/iron transport system ATP-binding protein
MTGRHRNVGWFRQPRAADHRAVAEALDRVGMTALRRRPVGQLSGGQRQRVLIARALALQPTVLLLDEPYTGLDMPTQESLTTLFTELSGEGRAVLMTTHDLVGALDACDRLCLINKTIVADGTAAELADPQVWIDAFEVSAGNPLISLLAAR